MRGGIAERAVEVVCAPKLSVHGYAGPEHQRTILELLTVAPAAL